MSKCAKCNYDLGGICVTTCPECGWNIDDPFPRDRDRWRTAEFAALTLLMGAAYVGPSSGAWIVALIWVKAFNEPGLWHWLIPPVLSLATILVAVVTPARGWRAPFSAAASLAWMVLVVGVLLNTPLVGWLMFLGTGVFGGAGLSGLARCALRDWKRITGQSDSPTDIVYVELLDEGVDVWRPVHALRIGDGKWIFQRAASAVAEEQWKFPLGSKVVCEYREFDTGPRLVAVRRSDP